MGTNSCKIIGLVFAIIACAFGLISICIYSDTDGMRASFGFVFAGFIENFDAYWNMGVGYAIYTVTGYFFNLVPSVLLLIICLIQKHCSPAVFLIPLAIPLLWQVFALIFLLVGDYSLDSALLTTAILVAAIFGFVCCAGTKSNTGRAIIAVVVASVLTIIAIVMMLKGITPFGLHYESTYSSSYNFDYYFVGTLVYYVALWFGVAFGMIGATPQPATEKAPAHVASSLAKSTTANAAPDSFASAADELKGYKELLDMDAITQEEFDEKKRHLIGL